MHLAHGLVGMGDDKERGFGWKVPYHAYLCALFLYVCNSDRWEFTSLTPQQANDHLVQTLQAWVPRRLHKWLAIGQCKWRLPHMYVTQKKTNV